MKYLAPSSRTTQRRARRLWFFFKDGEAAATTVAQERIPIYDPTPTEELSEVTKTR